MSGFLPDLASWALRGGAGNNEEEGSSSNNDSGGPRPQLTEDEIRARRLARITAMQAEPMQTDNNDDDDKMEVDTAAVDTADGDNDKMEVDEDKKKQETPVAKKEVVTPSPAPVQPQKVEAKMTPERKKKRAKEAAPADVSRKLQRKKELLLKKVLNIAIQKGDGSYVFVEVDDDEINIQTIAEILATRLSLSPSDMRTATPQKTELIPYLAHCHKKAAEELKSLKQSKADTQELEELLEEILKQVVSYAASSLMEPDLFETGQDGATQLAKCLINGTTDIASSITFGVTGPTSSFYYCLCEELVLQDMAAFACVITEAASYLTKSLSKCETVLDGGSEGGLVLVSAMTSLCSYKKAAVVLTEMPNFLLPPANSPQAQERVTPPPPTLPPGANSQQESLFRLMQAMNRQGGGYLKRSGPALEKDTVLGLALRLGCPRDNPAVTSAFGNLLMQSLDSIEKTIQTQRRQLKVYQDTLNQLIRCLITAGADARGKVS